MADEKKEKPKERKAKPNEEKIRFAEAKSGGVQRDSTKPEAKAPEAHAPKPAEKPVQAPKPAHAEAPKHEAMAETQKVPASHREAMQKPAEKSVAPKADAKPEPKKKKAKKKGVRVELARGKRKTSVARAAVKEGHGRIRVNSMLTSAMPNRFLREMIEEPLRLAGPEGNGLDVEVKVHGGGESGQAQASRTAIARALSQYFGENLKKSYEEADKYLLAEDPRRVEPKKYKGRKARARFQKSYR
ncbi:MAG: 30S ribosomal protein S9 [Candidatus Micrarchaeota archaeon]|nr:30S ribosomal protein S9 [Candidatus Micrarchaeota archaeon]